MNRKFNLVLWIVVGIAVFSAVYIANSKFKPLAESNLPKQTQNSNTNSDDSLNTSSSTSSPDTQKVMAPDFTLDTLDGKSVKLSDYRGKIVILNFWAVWCKYCKQEMPDLNELNKELEKGTDAVILAVDVQESEDTVKNYLSSNNINLNVLMDRDGSISNMYQVQGYPTTFIINKDGSIYTYIPQMTDKATLNTILDRIREGLPLQ
jgi:peroxiredoxin